MGFKKDKKGLTALQKRLQKLSAMPQHLDRELQHLAMEMADTAINMAPIYTGKMRDSIRYRRVSAERNAKGQFVKGGLGIHYVEFNYNRGDYFERVHEEMTIGRIGKGMKGILQPSERSVEVAASAGEVAGGLFMQRAFQRYQPIIAQKLRKASAEYIRMIYG